MRLSTVGSRACYRLRRRVQRLVLPVVGNVYTQTVPSALERQGNFTELLNTTLTGASQPITL